MRDQGSKSDPPGCGHIVGWKNNEGTNIQGSGPDGSFPGIGNQDSCQQECANYGDGCHGWTFVSGMCYLKSVVCPMKSENFEIYSGYCNPGAPTDFGPSCGGSPTPTPVPPTPPSPSGGCSGYNDFMGYNNGGDNIWGSGSDGYWPEYSQGTADCQGGCASYGDGCKGWTWTNNKCYLKSKVCRMQTASGDAWAASGYCNPASPDQDHLTC